MLAGTVPSPYFDLDPTADPDAARFDVGGPDRTGPDTAGRDWAAVHTAAADRLARLGRWEQA